MVTIAVQSVEDAAVMDYAQMPAFSAAEASINAILRPNCAAKVKVVFQLVHNAAMTVDTVSLATNATMFRECLVTSAAQIHIVQQR